MYIKYKKIGLALIISGLAVFSSCNKNYLVKNPHDSLPFNQAILTETDLEAAVNGLYSSLRWGGLYGSNVPIIGDVYADNVYVSPLNAGYFIQYNNYTVKNEDGGAANIWTTAYTSILYANQVITSTLPVDTNVNQLKGEAYAIRGLLYFELLKWFAKPYSTANASGPGVPIVLAYDINAKPKRSTIGDVYTQIIKDLNSSIALLKVQKSSEYVSVWTAKGLLAKVYQYMGDWDNAKKYALDVVANSGYTLVDSANFLQYWNVPGATTQSETLLEISEDGINNNGNTSPASYYSQDGYGELLCDSNFYNTYSQADVRSQLFTAGTRGGDPAIIVNKYPNYTNTTHQDDAKILRLAEVYLILAEAYHMLGDDVNARVYLNDIATIRQPSFAGYTSSGDSLLNNITNERRKELAFEGNRLMDLNRLGKDINRGPQFPSSALSIRASDNRRILPIPINELNANPNIVQNPGY